MNRREDEEDEEKVVALGAPDAIPEQRLPYAVELWDMLRSKRERVIGRAASMVLARAIFVAAQSEHLSRKVVLRRGAKVLLESD